MNAIAEYVKHTIECAENKSVVITDYSALDKYLVDCGSFVALRNIVHKFERENRGEWGRLPAEIAKNPRATAKPRLPKVDRKLVKAIKHHTKKTLVKKPKAQKRTAKKRKVTKGKRA